MDNPQAFLEHDLASRWQAPGCAAAIVKDGQLLAKHAWGYANLETRAPLTTETIFPICSISKQMVCLVLWDLLDGPNGTDIEAKIFDTLREILPAETMSNHDLTISRLVGMQSGLRDYWALSVLWGAAPQSRFSLYQDAPQAMKRLGGYHFSPGSELSYCNSNYVAISLAIEKVTGRTLRDLLQEKVFMPAGMKTAALRPDTSRIPAPMVGYEGGETAGYIRYANRIEWAGDAGVMASLEDMIAYEKYVHRSAADANSIYYKMSREPTYIDGNVAHYGSGLMRGKLAGKDGNPDMEWVGHSGGLAGFRLRRTFFPKHNLSIVTLFNSEIDTMAVTEYAAKRLILGASIEQTLPQRKKDPDWDGWISWTGNYFDLDARLAVVVRQDKPHHIQVNYGGHDEGLDLTGRGTATSKYMTIDTAPDGPLAIHRPKENREFAAQLIHTPTNPYHIRADYVGEYYSADIDSTMHITGSGSVLYAAFDGYLGKGPVHTMRYLGAHVWLMSCFRSLDAPSPGFWTVEFAGDGGEAVTGATVGCSIARKVEYKKKA
ncbi:D-aminopeptidase [Cyphellophora attinorum]|uniref:D-aminopeptidase n=1 Tax=Cyphellophora attinorum TaxID=1664694 RepID=A0A0N1H4F8_9EURO|nr:D-aminopeptidase [Phialophora attinorum]KPI36120.1 D-aminopeptidase [Phialophora attinorum]